MGNIKKYVKNDKFAELIGIELIKIMPGKARAKLELTPDHLNSSGIAHGGLIFTLADYAFSAAANSHETTTLDINASVSYIKAVKAGTLYAEAKEISINPKIATYRVDITDKCGDMIAIFQGMVYRKKESIYINDE